MSKTITIDPITRIEGHSKITIQLDEAGEVTDAHFHVTQFRGFEKFVEGRPVHEMPSIMARICGICPVSHLVASAKAVDDILAVDPPPTGADLRQCSREDLARVLGALDAIRAFQPFRPGAAQDAHPARGIDLAQVGRELLRHDPLEQA